MNETTLRWLAGLAGLLLLLSFGHTAARGSQRIVRDSLIAFAWWAGAFGVLCLLVTFAGVLVWLIRVVAGFAALYVCWLLVREIYVIASGLPQLHHVRRSQVRRACKTAFGDEGDCAYAAVATARETSWEVALDAVVSQRGKDLPPERVAEVVREESQRIEKENGELVGRIRDVTGKRRIGDRRFVDGLVLRCGRGAVERVLRRLEADRANASRHRLMTLAMSEADEPVRGVALGLAGVDAPSPAMSGRAPEIGPLLMLLAFLLPFTVYVAHRQWRRTVFFAVPYFVLLSYMIYCFVHGMSAALAFLAGVALLHVSALFHLGAVLSQETGRP